MLLCDPFRVEGLGRAILRVPPGAIQLLPLRGMIQLLPLRGVIRPWPLRGTILVLPSEVTVEVALDIREDHHLESGCVPHSLWITQSNRRPLTTNTARSSPAWARRP